MSSERTASGALRSHPYKICARWYDVGGERSLFIFGRAANKPFGLIPTGRSAWQVSCLLRGIKMIGKRCFVQFPHPGCEPRPDPNGKIGWNNTPDHKRKFMQLCGEWIEGGWLQAVRRLVDMG